MSDQRGPGMYEITDPTYPQVKIGEYTICRQDGKSIWIQNEDKKGGSFKDEVFERVIDDFFNKYF